MASHRGRRRLSLRVRITAGALIVVLAAVGGAGLAVIRVVQRGMVSQIDDTLTSTADFIGRALTNGDGLPTREGPNDLFVQFVSADGRVLGASDAAHGIPALVPPAGHDAGPHGVITTTSNRRLGPLRVLSQPSPTNPRVTLVVARSSASVDDVRSSLQRALLATTAALTVFVGFVIWVVVGRALRPVDEMARTVNAIDDSQLHQRIERPMTGDELDRLADTLNDLLARVDDAVARERQFVSDASHELRTPIAGVRALLETEPADPREVREGRAEALVTLGRLQDLVDELLLLAKADETALASPRAPVDLDELVLGQARQLERTTNLHMDTTRVSGGQVLGRDTDLGRLVENLATNAARYATSTVAFGVHQTNDLVEFTVEDDGPGIAEADHARIFERFTTLEDSRASDREGAGLGLAIVSAIVVSHHGSISADGAPGGGARFTVHLPAASAASATPDPVETPA